MYTVLVYIKFINLEKYKKTTLILNRCQYDLRLDKTATIHSFIVQISHGAVEFITKLLNTNYKKDLKLFK